jgi:hypothetical protein
VSRVVLVLTLSMTSKEGQRPYRSQSDNPLQGTTLGGSADDPRRQRTRNAAAGHAARAGARQYQRGMPGTGDLAHPVLSMAEALRSVRGGWRSSAAPAGWPGPPYPGAGRGRAVGAERGDQYGDVGLRPDRGVPHGPGDCAWRRARCNGFCAERAWPPAARVSRCSSITPRAPRAC